ncbi:hypothetical protein CC80DRAFT_492806 [Byssothecium circinans]|uniref:Apple domain-containing protein n=1 Tax=Byssothecium circinans TaxID=147558 RepID=A0A6A5TVU1_9PLEO|nr:hypothetical protein CC80DRAFT_492806 [Byssothecium circinans]
MDASSIRLTGLFTRHRHRLGNDRWLHRQSNRVEFPSCKPSPPSSPSSSSASTPPHPPSCSAPANTTTPNPTNSTVERITCDATTSRSARYSTVASVPYKVFCHVDWVQYDIVATLALTTSECIESCWTYNGYNPGGDRECVGATWVPDWGVDVQAAWKLVNRPSNCFLKSKVEGFPASKVGWVDAVGLCLEGKCPAENT